MSIGFVVVRGRPRGHGIACHGRECGGRRLLLPNFGGVNYHELIVARDATGEPRISDIYVHLSGELVSQTIRRLLLPAYAAENRGLWARLTGSEAALV
jgi:hypothetical protein